MRVKNMGIKGSIASLLVLAAGLTLLIGCGTAPASQSPEIAPAPDSSRVFQPTAPAQPDSSKPEAVEVKPEPQAVEVGYKVGMRAPEFGMNLLDGANVTSASLAEQGKPAFIYFHATW